MDEWEKFNKSSLPEKKKKLYQHKYGTYCMHAKSVCKHFEIKNLGGLWNKKI